MKKTLFLFVLIFVIGTISYADTVNNLIFSDVEPSYWGYLAISRMVEDGVVKGYEDGTFRPDKAITRAEFAKIFAIALDVNDEEETLGSEVIVDDVEDDHWAYSYIKSTFVYFPRIENGRNIFEPNELITREDAAYALAQRILPGEQFLSALNIFIDKEEISKEKIESVSAAVDKGIINGLGDGRLNPKGNLTRAQVCTLIYNIKYKLHLYENYLKFGDILKCIEYNINLNGDEPNKVSVELIFDVPSIESVDGYVMTLDNKRLENKIEYGITKNENFKDMPNAIFTFDADSKDEYRVYINRLTTKEGIKTYDKEFLIVYDPDGRLNLKYDGTINKKTEISFEWSSQYGVPTKNIEWSLNDKNIKGKVENNSFSVANDIIKVLDNKSLDKRIDVTLIAEDDANPQYNLCIYKYNIYDIKK